MPITPDAFILNKYKIRKPIGEGGMASVWLAEETAFGNRPVAIKQPRADLPPVDQDDVQRRFHQEVTVCAALEQVNAKHIVRTFTAEPFEQNLLLVMAYMPGGDLAQRIAAHPNGMPLDEVIAIARALLAALQAAHEHPMEIVHRDLKPSNVLFDDKGVAHLADFGLAQIAGHSGRSQLKGSAHPGSPLYMAPEQAGGTGYLTPAADLYALGCLLFEMMTGKRYKRVRPGTRASQAKEGVPSWLDDVLARALVEDPFDRYEGAEEMLSALQGGPNQEAQKRRQAEEAERRRQAAQEEKRKQAEELEKRRQAEETEKRLQAAETKRRQMEEAERRRQSEEAEQHRQAQAEERRKATPTPLWQKIGIEKVSIPAGLFLYGKGKQAVDLAEFCISRTPITNAQYKAFVDATNYVVPLHWKEGRIPGGKEKHPVVYVSWKDANAFCQWAGARLPTVREWEKAARGTDGREYPWGHTYPTTELCNFDMNVGDTTPIDRYPKGVSPYGLFDMAGNVWEWCAEWMNHNQTFRVLRGGAFNYKYGDVRCTSLGKSIEDDRNYNIGFRVVIAG